MKSILAMVGLILSGISLTFSQNAYFFGPEAEFDASIPSPAGFLGYDIGSHHTRHDQIVAYFSELARLSDRAEIEIFGRTHEHRAQVMLTISSPDHLARLEEIRTAHLEWCDPEQTLPRPANMPVLTHLGYNVHGNEPSSAESALLTAYFLVAGKGKRVENILKESVVFIDPVINPDGRDRHTHWANMHKGTPLVSDPLDREHQEVWPGGRTNHYWFDLNRDWLLLVNPELQSKLRWYHSWLPNVTTDFHEMGSQSTYFFEPMKTNGSKDPIMPRENYTTLNDSFAVFYHRYLDEIGSLYFSKEVFDGTYPGYGSSYPDLQGGLGILFEQASARGHQQVSPKGEKGLITFAFAIRNHLTSSLATMEAAVKHKDLLQTYQREFFSSALSRGKKDRVKTYVFGDLHDQGRNRAFLKLLLQHQIEVLPSQVSIRRNGQVFEPGSSWLVPTEQPQYRMVQTMFETYEEYHDSVFYDASAWSLANAYNLPYLGLTDMSFSSTNPVTMEDLERELPTLEMGEYGYLMEWQEYEAPAALHQLQQAGLVCMAAFKPFSLEGKSYEYGTIFIPQQIQKHAPERVHELLVSVLQQFEVKIHPVQSGYSQSGADLGSGYVRSLQAPKALMLVGEGVSGYEAGEVWHLLDTRIHMPITKVDMNDLNRVNWWKYNTLVLVSGRYNLSESQLNQLRQWISAGNTLITTRTASQWAIQSGLVEEELIAIPKDTGSARLPYVQAREIAGARQVGGAIFEVELDLTHPLAFGYQRSQLPVYRNSRVYLKPSENPYATVGVYTDDPHIDGYVSQENLSVIKGSASLLVSRVGGGRAILFSDNPNFRGTWYGTNRLFLNALFLGNEIQVPGQ